MFILYKRSAPFLVASCLFILLQGCNRSLPKTPKQRTLEHRRLRIEGKRIFKLFSKHKYAQVIPLYLDNAREAARLGDFEFAARYLVNAGGVQLMLFRYQDALSTMERARKAADRTEDRDVIATANANIASLYLQMGNLNGAAQAGDRALAVLRDGHPQYSRVVIPVSQVRAGQHEFAKAEALMRKAADFAFRTGDMETVAWSLDYIGDRYDREMRLEEADRVLTESLRIRKMFHAPDLASSYYLLARVRSDQKDFRSAAALLDAAVEELTTPGNVTPSWNVYLERGRLFARSKNQEAAWENLKKAVVLARDWRSEVVANDANRTSTEEALSELYSLYIEVGNNYAAARGISLARETFQAAEENRTASLRALAERETGWHTKLPAVYWDLLQQLQAAERAVLQSDSPANVAAVSGLRSQLDEIEAASGAPHGFVIEPASMAAQKKLDENTVLLSFQLGERTSWLWAVTKQEVAVYPLPSRTVLTKQIHEFQESVRRGSPLMDQQGARLYTVLFGALPEHFSSPERWLFSLDQELFSLPMPALVVRFAGSTPLYLGAAHALEATPGALIFAASNARSGFDGPMLAVGDAIYNRADSRLKSGVMLQAGLNLPLPALISDSNLQFARLWGAAGEMEAVKTTWNEPGSISLSGTDVSPGRIWKELDRKPAVIHFATHILEAHDQLHTGWIALGMNSSGRSEFLSPADISAHKLNSGLVVLNGCSSGNGEVRAASGLMGLTRAWIAAGASEVLATRWPGPDDNGSFFTDFYRHLKSFPEKGSSFALRDACRRSINANGWRAKPQFWASYFLTGIK